jgi:hypothetical protein
VSILDQLRDVRECATAEDERLRRAGATQVECSLGMPMETLDAIILHLEDLYRINEDLDCINAALVRLNDDLGRRSERMARWYLVSVLVWLAAMVTVINLLG